MSKFALEKMELIKGKQIFNKLLVDGKAPFDCFTEELEEQYKSELGSIYYRMEAVANLQLLPKDKFRELKGGKGIQVETLKSICHSSKRRQNSCDGRV